LAGAVELVETQKQSLFGAQSVMQVPLVSQLNSQSPPLQLKSQLASSAHSI
jgi:hypothetical protein